MAAKVDGAVALMALTQRDPLRWFVGFGSLSGRFGGNGLSDYAAANDMLAKLIAAFRRRRPQCAAGCIHWQTWDEVGMATLADGVAITKNVLQMAFIPPAEGIEHSAPGASRGAAQPRDCHHRRTFPADLLSGPTAGRCRSTSEADSPAGTVPFVATTRAGPRSARPWPVGRVGRWRERTAGWAVWPAVGIPRPIPFLLQHRLRDKPFLPGVIGWEALAEAASLADRERGTVVALRDVEITNGMLFHGPEPIEAECLVDRDRGRPGLLADQPAVRPEGPADRCPPTSHAGGCRNWASGRRRSSLRRRVSRRLGWLAIQYQENGLLVSRRAAALSEGMGDPVRRRLGADRGPVRWPNWRGPARRPAGFCRRRCSTPACTPAAASSSSSLAGRSKRRTGWSGWSGRASPRPGENCLVRFYFRGRDQRHSRFDFTLFGEDQRPLLQAIRLPHGADCLGRIARCRPCPTGAAMRP